MNLIKVIGKRMAFTIFYGMPVLPRNYNPREIKNFFDLVGNIKSCAIIGRGSSIFHCNPINEIKKCDFKIILSRVEIENLRDFLGDTIDAQIANNHNYLVGLPKKLVREFNVKFLMYSSSMKQDGFRKFYSYYRNRNVPITCFPEQNLLKYEFSKYDYPSKTVCSTILKALYNIDTLEKIVFAGVDFFRYDYHNKKLGWGIPPMRVDAKEYSGDPLMKFIFETVPKRNEIRPLTAYFPMILKDIIDFPELPCFQFYRGA